MAGRPSHLATFDSFAAFFSDFRRHFSPIDRVLKARNELAVWKQTSSISEAIHRFKDITIRIPNISEEEMLDRFRRGLKLSVRRELEKGFPKSLDEAMAIADKLSSVGDAEH
eukprot:Sdes_comp15870_c0_seq1m4969